MADSPTLYSQLGGYDAIAAVADDFFGRVASDAQLGRFWAHRGDDGVRREKQLLIDYLCACSGGPMVYTGRDMETAHKGMRVSKDDWEIFIGHLQATLTHFDLPQAVLAAVLGFIESSKGEVVEC